MRCVLDSSAALAWILPGADADGADALLNEVAQRGAAAPGLWPLEVANVLWQAERRGRITTAERTQALGLLGALPVAIDGRTAELSFTSIAAAAASHGLTVYDASYLELAMRLGLPLASFDTDLRRAAVACGVTVLTGG